MTMTIDATCWQCGAALQELPLPLGRSAECPQCRVALRCCRFCTFYDPRASKECREPQVEPVLEKERANFCDYFRLRAKEDQTTPPAASACARLAALFDGPPGAATPRSEDAARQALAQLFSKK